MITTKSDRDRETLEAMGRIYCHAHHADAMKDVAGLCESCRETVSATLARTDACPYGHIGNCQDCETHCQHGEARERIRAIMRYAAPRMVACHPLMTAEYLLKKLQKKRQPLQRAPRTRL